MQAMIQKLKDYEPKNSHLEVVYEANTNWFSWRICVACSIAANKIP
jgi:hypothetical protein